MGIFIIEGVWKDSMENNISNAFGYYTRGYVETEEEAKDICAKAGVVGKKFCWAAKGDEPKLRYSKLERFKQTESQ